MRQFEIAGELSRVYSLEIDAAHAYHAARNLLFPGPVNDELALFELEHQRHALVLLDVFLRLGQNPPEHEPDVKGLLIGALTAPDRILTLEDIVERLRGNEQLTNSVFSKVLAKVLPPGVREILEPFREDERKHLEWMERAMARRIWEEPSAHP